VNVGSLFSGIGGFELGFERAGMRVSWQVEQDAYCRAVLTQHFPDAARFEDVREVGARELDPVDLICGGFPCQDLSSAGKGAGLDGARSGLWSEFARIVRELRPRYVVVENVPALLTGKGKRWDRGPIGRVLGDLAEARYDAEWACLSAREFGAPHLRKRVWIVAYPARDAEAGAATEPGSEWQRARAGGPQGRTRELPDADRDGCPQGLLLGTGSEQSAGSADAFRGCAVATVADAEGSGREARDADRLGEGEPPEGPSRPGWWSAEPGVGRVADGVPHRVDRLAALGNALVPQIAEWIGRRILEYESATGSRWEPVS
jgi:DNA (cytosine-5)-methyltransferase 1